MLCSRNLLGIPLRKLGEDVKSRMLIISCSLRTAVLLLLAFPLVPHPCAQSHQQRWYSFPERCGLLYVRLSSVRAYIGIA